MLPHHSLLENHLRKKSKQQLIDLISASYQLSSDESIWKLFNDLVYEVYLTDLNAEWIRERIDIFYSDSLRGKYYEPCDTNAKSIMEIPERTNIWFFELATLLDLCCELVLKGQTVQARFGLSKLIDLIDNKMLESEIVYADELGDWMIVCRHDYRKVYESISTDYSKN